MTGARTLLVQAALLSLLAVAPAVRAETRHALVVGNGSYAHLAAIDPCKPSVASLSGALRRAGYQVIERLNPSNAQMGAAIAEFSEQLQRSGGTAAVAYFCGYATALDSRLFLLPASANLASDTDVLSQGIVARVLANAVWRAPARTGLLLLDVFSLPGRNAALPLGALVEPAQMGGKGLAAVHSLGAVPSGTTELAAAAAQALASGGGDARAWVGTLRSRLAASAQRVVVLHEPAEAATPPTAAAAAVRAPAPSAAAATAAGGAGDLAALSAADMRRAQLALQQLGYYSGKVDGVVGADTLAAVRRFQHELRAPMTGQLTRAQASRLLGPLP